MQDNQIVARDAPGLLISVRNAEEAIAALEGGADWIDVKEPRHGPLGAASYEAVEQVVRAVDGRAPVSVAAGELLERSEDADGTPAVARGVRLVKLGLSRCGLAENWSDRWRAAQSQVAPAGLVAVVYADWQRAAAPPPDEVFSVGQRYRSPALLVDTYDKSHGNVLDHWPLPRLKEFTERVRRTGMALVLAGSLDEHCLCQIAALRPAMLGMRGAACDGGRSGQVCSRRVAALRAQIEQACCGNPPPRQAWGPRAARVGRDPIGTPEFS